jgi:2-methylisocitrate lyase-like PEP mutase family enzyme
MSYGDAFRNEVRSGNITPLIGVFDMFSASVAAQHYGGLFISGFGFVASHYGLPEIGFIARRDMVNFVQRLRLAFPEHHLLVDIDDGYVDPEVACHVVENLERIGASGVVLEDQKRPRHCGRVDGKRILPLEEYLEELNLVLETRRDLLVLFPAQTVGLVILPLMLFHQIQLMTCAWLARRYAARTAQLDPYPTTAGATT